MIRYIRRQPEFLFVLGGLALVVAGMGAVRLPALWGRATAWSEESHRLTLAELATNPPTEITHVVVTDFDCGDDFVYEARRKKRAPAPKQDEAGFGRAWIPLFAKAGGPGNVPQPSPTKFVVLLETAPTITTATGKHLLSRTREMEGIAVPMSRSNVPTDVRDKLVERYPDTRFDACIVLEQADKVRKKDSGFFAYAATTITGLAFVMAVVAIPLGFALRRRLRRRRRGPPPLPPGSRGKG